MGYPESDSYIGGRPLSTECLDDDGFFDYKEMAKDYRIGKLVLFGSRARRTHEGKSDVDLAVYGCTRFRDFAFDVNEKVETLLSFDIINMDESPSAELVAEIERDGVTLYEKV